MADASFLFESVLRLLTTIFSFEFSLWGVEINVGGMFLFSLLLGLLLWFLQSLSE